MKAEELRRLNGYGWVDRKAGIAHIPIDRAMDIVATTGLPQGRRSRARRGRASANLYSTGDEKRSRETQTDQPESKQGQKP